MLPHGECGTMGQSGLMPSAIPYFCRFCGKPIKTIARRAVGRPPQDQGFSLFTNRRERRGSAGRNGGGSMRVTTCEAKMADLERRIAVLRGPNSPRVRPHPATGSQVRVQLALRPRVAGGPARLAAALRAVVTTDATESRTPSDLRGTGVPTAQLHGPLVPESCA